jgi:multidrug resistance efflux pump
VNLLFAKTYLIYVISVLSNLFTIMSEEINKIEIRSEQVQEILGYIPHWIIRSGIEVIFVVLLLLFIGSWFFKYPDIISSSISVTTENPPASLVAKTSGKIDSLFVEDKQLVKENEILAIIENTANHKDVLELKTMLDSMKQFFLDYKTSQYQSFNQVFELGAIQTSYSSFLRQYYEYQNFINLNYHQQKIFALKKQLEKTKLQFLGQQKQSQLSKEEMKLAAKQFSRDSGLFERKVIPPSEVVSE